MSEATDQFDALEARGKPDPPVGLQPTDNIVRWQNCPDCKGRGWYLIHPFKTSPWPAGGVENTCQCLTCVHAKKFYEEHGREPFLLER